MLVSSVILKALFSSQTRVKLLSTFLLHRGKGIRELTRLLNDQSIAVVTTCAISDSCARAIATARSTITDPDFPALP